MNPTCDPVLIACQISHLPERLDGWDWNGFASTLIATLVGALLGLVGVWLGFRWQRNQRYNEILDDCIVRVLEQIAVHATALSAF